jgi:hypothetical protein
MVEACRAVSTLEWGRPVLSPPVIIQPIHILAQPISWKVHQYHSRVPRTRLHTSCKRKCTGYAWNSALFAHVPTEDGKRVEVKRPHKGTDYRRPPCTSSRRCGKNISDFCGTPTSVPQVDTDSAYQAELSELNEAQTAQNLP